MVLSAMDGRKVRAAERREETRERLLVAAQAVFAEQGFHAGTIKAITRRAGVAEGLLFHYFPTKADLLVAVLARDPLRAEMERSIAEQADRPVAEALPAMAHHWLAVARARGPVTRVLLQEAHADPQVREAVAREVRGTTDLLATYFAARMASGELRPLDPRVVAQSVLQALFSLVVQCGHALDGDEETLLGQQLDLLLYGLVAQGSARAAATCPAAGADAGR